MLSLSSEQLLDRLAQGQEKGARKQSTNMADGQEHHSKSKRFRTYAM